MCRDCQDVLLPTLRDCPKKFTQAIVDHVVKNGTLCEDAELLIMFGKSLREKDYEFLYKSGIQINLFKYYQTGINPCLSFFVYLNPTFSSTIVSPSCLPARWEDALSTIQHDVDYSTLERYRIYYRKNMDDMCLLLEDLYRDHERNDYLQYANSILF